MTRFVSMKVLTIAFFMNFAHLIQPTEETTSGLLTGHVPGPFYYRQGNTVEKPWKDRWGCVGSSDYIADVPEPYLREKIRRAAATSGSNAGAGINSPVGRSASSSSAQRHLPDRRSFGRLLHGDPAAHNDFPYVVSVVNTAVPKEGVAAPRSPSVTGRRFCAGAIIHRRHILTAASCVSGATPETLQVRAAGIDITNKDDGVKIDISDIRPHPEFSTVLNAYWNDIAILRTASELDLSGPTMKAICPPVQQHSGWLHRRIGQRGMVASWGSTQYKGPTAEKQRYGEFQAVPTIVCQGYAFLTYFRPLPAAQILCAHGDGGVVRALCTGDSGAPYVVLDHDTGLPTLVGIAMVPPNEDCLEYQVSLFTRVDNYLDWIEKSITTIRWA